MTFDSITGILSIDSSDFATYGGTTHGLKLVIESSTSTDALGRVETEITLNMDYSCLDDAITLVGNTADTTYEVDSGAATVIPVSWTQ